MLFDSCYLEYNFFIWLNFECICTYMKMKSRDILTDLQTLNQVLYYALEVPRVSPGSLWYTQWFDS